MILMVERKKFEMVKEESLRAHNCNGQLKATKPKLILINMMTRKDKNS